METKMTKFLAGKFEMCDLVLARIPKYDQQHGIVELGKIYRTKFLFPHRYFALGHKQIEFIGGGRVFGDISNYEGEVGLLFLCLLNNKIYQEHFQGHFPIERHEDGLWCLIYGVKLWELRDIPSSLADNCKPNRRRLNKQGQSFDTWVRFDALEAYLIGLIAEIDQKPCEPFELNDFRPWLNELPITKS